MARFKQTNAKMGSVCPAVTLHKPTFKVTIPKVGSECVCYCTTAHDKIQTHICRDENLMLLTKRIVDPIVGLITME